MAKQTAKQRNCRYHKKPYKPFKLDTSDDDTYLRIRYGKGTYFLEFGGRDEITWDDGDGWTEYEDCYWSFGSDINFCPMCGLDLSEVHPKPDDLDDDGFTYDYDPPINE